MRLSIAAVLILFLSTANSQVWVQLADYPGQELRGAVSFTIDGHGYMVGGYTGTETLDDAWRYSPDNDSWLEILSMPVPMRFATGFSIGGYGYVVGGINSTTGHSDRVFRYNPVSNVWDEMSSFPGGERYGMFGFVINELGYVGCGNSGDAMGPLYHDCYRYDPSTDLWESVATIPTLPKFGVTGFSKNGKGYVMCGSNGTEWTSDVLTYDPDSNTWTQVADYPTEGSYQVVLNTEESVIVSGGPSGSTHETFQYFPEYDVWYTFEEYLGGSPYTAAYFSIDDQYYVCGGYHPDDFTYQRDVWELTNIPAVGLEDLTDTEPVLVWPNPMSTIAEITVRGLDSPFQIQLFDMTGKQMRSISIASKVDSYLLSRDNLTNGVYFLVIRSEKGIRQTRLLIE